MTWSTKNKKIQIKSTTPHAPTATPGVKGRAPAVREIHFTPQELFGAMARCSHLHPINPSAVTFESEGCRHLIAQHVDEHADDFFILPTVKRLKDFSRTHLIGVVGAAIAYLQMVRDGYVWCDHFENLIPLSPTPTKRTPDFVFNRPDEADVAIVESKATVGSSRTQFKGTVRRGYLMQVEPYLGHTLSGAIASHGFSVGSWMTSTKRAEVVIDYTAQPAYVAPGAPGTPRAVRRGNYLTVLSLMFGPTVAASARAGAWPSAETRLVMARWLDRNWLLGIPLRFRTSRSWSLYEVGFALDVDWSVRLPDMVFALESNIAGALFRSLASQGDAPDPLNDLGRIDGSLVERATEAGGAIFPDGFAVIPTDTSLEVNGIRQWTPQSGGEVAERIVNDSNAVNGDLVRADPTDSSSQITEEESRGT